MFFCVFHAFAPERKRPFTAFFLVDHTIRSQVSIGRGVASLISKHFRFQLLENYKVFILIRRKDRDMPKEQEVREVVGRLRREGWAEYPGKGSHRVFRKDGTTISVPTSKKELPTGTNRKVARDAGWL